MVDGIDAVDNRTAVRAVLGDRHPDVLAVVVDAARVIDRAFPQRQIGNQMAGHVELEQVAGAGAAIASKRRPLRRRFVGTVTSTDDTNSVSPIFTIPCG
jgi:hypothetical protein